MFARWDRPDEMRALIAGLGQVKPRTLAARKSTERADRYQWPLLLAVLLLFAAERIGATAAVGGPGTDVTLSRRRRGRSFHGAQAPSPAAQGDNG